MKYGLVILTVGLFSGALWAQDGPDPLGFNAKWNNALELQSNDGSASLKVGGRIMLDNAFFSDDSGAEDGTEFRRTRLMLSGKVNDFEWKTQYDFASVKAGGPAFKDVYVGLGGVPYAGALRAGHFKEPFGLEELTSSKYMTFMERSLTSAFAPSRNVGVMAHRALDGGTLAYGVFRTTNDLGFDTGDGDYSATGRYTRTINTEGGSLIHLGGALSTRSLQADLSLEPRASSHLGPKAAEGTVAGADGEFRYGVEAAYVNGAFSLQGEFMGSSVSADDNVSYTGWYVMGSYFLTGESRPYDSKKGIFKRVKPAKEFAWGESWGATELAARYGSVNYSDFAGGVTLDDLTVGVNIYHNPVFRTMLNYVYSDMGGDGAEAMHSFMMRWQIGM